MVAEAFRAVKIEFPFLGLKQGPMMHAINVAIEAGQMFQRR